MCARVPLSNRIRVFEFVAAFLGLILEADTEGANITLPRFGQQRHQQARIQPAGQ